LNAPAVYKMEEKAGLEGTVLPQGGDAFEFGDANELPEETPAGDPDQTVEMTVACPRCGALYSINTEHLGQTFMCQNCSSLFQVPGSAAEDDAATLPVTAESEGESGSDAVRIAGRYRIIRMIGKGGMGAVYLAHDEILDVDVALKVLRYEELSGEEEVARFLREARSAAILDHPNIVRVLNAGFDERGYPFIAMQFIKGNSLDRLIRERREAGKAKTRLSDRRLVQIFCDVASALAYAHKKGIIHRDIKPGNVLVSEDGRAYLVDFGLARRVGGGRRAGSFLTVSGALLGTPDYMSPEQAEGKASQATPASDIFSFGAMMYHAFCGRPPFHADNMWSTLTKILNEEPVLPRKLNPAIHPDLDAIIMRCLEKDPRRRYRDGAELLSDLRRHLRGEPVSARPVGSLSILLRRLKKHKAALVAATSLLALVIVVLLLSMRHSSQQQQKLNLRRKEAKILLTKAKQAFKQGRYEEALALVSESLGKHKTREAELLKQKCNQKIAEARMRRQRRKKAEELLKTLELAGTLKQKLDILDEAIRLCPDWQELHIRKGKLLHRAGRFKEALTEFRRALDVAKKRDNAAEQALAHFHMGLIFCRRYLATLKEQEGRTELLNTALRHFGKIGELLPGVQNEYTLFSEAAHAHFLHRNPDSALELYSKALKMNSNFAIAYLLRALCWQDKGEFEKALADYNRVIELEPEWLVAYLNRAHCKKRIGKVSEALNDLTELLQKHPTFLKAYVQRSNILREQGRYDEAIRDVGQIIRLAPGYAAAYINRGILWLRKQEFNKALRDFNRAIQLKPSGIAYMNRALVWEARGDLKSALADLTKAIELAPDLAVAYHNRGRLRMRTGNLNGALNDFNRAISLGLKNAEVFHARGIIRVKLRDLAGAIRDFTKAVELAPNHYAALYNRGLVKSMLGKIDGAVSDLRQVVRLKPDYWDAWWALSWLYAKKRDERNCLEALRKAIALNPKVKEYARRTPDFRWLNDNPEFRRLTR